MKLFILSFFFPVFVLGASTEGCLSRLATDLATPEQKITVIMMECNNLFLKGQFKFLKKPVSNDNTRFKGTDHINALEMADGLIAYVACEDMSRLVKRYMKECSGK